MSNPININIHVGDFTRISNPVAEATAQAAEKTLERIREEKRGVLERVASAVTRKQVFIIKETARISKKILKAMLLEALPDMAVKVIKLAPALLAVIV